MLLETSGWLNLQEEIYRHNKVQFGEKLLCEYVKHPEPFWFTFKKFCHI